MPNTKERMTIKRAKELCREKYGRLPRMGYEMLAEEGTEETTIKNLDGQPITRPFPFKTYLENVSGTFRVHTYWDISRLPLRSV